MKKQKKLSPFERALLREQQAEQEQLEQAFGIEKLAQSWKGIAAAMEEATPEQAEKVVPIYYLWRAMATAVGLLLLTWGYHFYTLQQVPLATPVANESTLLPPEIQQAEQASFVTLQQDLEQLQKRDTAQWIAPQTLEALQELELAYQQLKQELLEEQNGRILIEEMLENLRLRHHILEQSALQLERIEQLSEQQFNYKEL